MLISDCFEINVPKSGSTGSQHWVSFYWSAFDRFEAWKLYIALFFCVLPGDCRAASHGLYFTKFQRGHTLRGAKDRRGIKISRFSTNKSLYLANDTRYCHSYYGRRIGTRMLSINGAISNDRERTLTLFSRSYHSLTPNISKTATYTAIVTIEGE